MRLIYFSHLFPRQNLPEYGLNVFNAAIRVGMDVLVLTRKLPGRLVETPASVIVHQISYINSQLQSIKSNNTKRIMGYIQSLLGQISLAINAILPARAFHPGIIHSFGALTLPAAYAARMATGAPVVVSLHGTDFHRIIKSNLLVRWVGLADAIVCVSQNMVMALHEKLPNKPIYYCPSGVDLSIFKADPSIQRQDLIVCNGRLTFVKRYDLILESFARVIVELPNYQLLILGRGELLPVLQEKARALGIDNRVIFGGVVNKNEVARILRSARLFLLTSDWEGTPKALLEAMASGVPAVVTDVGDCSSIIQGAGRIVSDNSPGTIAHTIVDLIREGKWDDLSLQAINNASKFGWLEVTEKLVQVYRKVYLGVSS